MRSPSEARTRWAKTLKHARSLAELQRAVRQDGPESPCAAGCRSLCWKILLLFPDLPVSEWTTALSRYRKDYAEQSEQLLKFTKHPEELANVALDPLTDDPESPWNTLRHDETIRAEIAQDVQRLPDEPLYHEPTWQTMIIDVLFVYCKLHPGNGGYRQGMHELLAPIVHVLYQDAVDRHHFTEESPDDAAMLDVLDSLFVEHDAFALFSRIMDHAVNFYELGGSSTEPASGWDSREKAETSAIVERSKYIHEVCLAKVDPELAKHLKDADVLPQIFLIRWIRLLLGREFPFEQLLELWDALFAVDPTLDLIDLICVAMLIRIRWDLLQSDYSHCLQLLLKYPAPTEEHGPHTFIDDAIYLKRHFNASGGASLIVKYTGKLPSEALPGDQRPRTPSFRGQNSEQRMRMVRSPLSNPGKFIQQQGGMEAIFQGAAKNVLNRGEKLGINQAVRDAVGEIRRNVQGFNESRYSPRTARQMLVDDSATRAMAALEKRNKLLASMLDDSIVNLKSVATSSSEDRARMLELVEMAVARMQFVKVHLEDSTIDVPEMEDQSLRLDEGVAINSDGTAEKSTASPNVGSEVNADFIPALTIAGENSCEAKTPELQPSNPTRSASASDAKDASPDAKSFTSDKLRTKDANGSSSTQKENRPHPPIPTRSTLAQSSFSWMLEPDETASQSATPPKAASPKGVQASDRHANRSSRPSSNMNRDRNAFLFGDVASEPEGSVQAAVEDLFGMEPLERKGRAGTGPL